MRWRVTLDAKAYRSATPRTAPAVQTSVHEVEGDVVVVGTGADCDVVVPASIWSRHADAGAPRVALLVRPRSPGTARGRGDAEVVFCCSSAFVGGGRDMTSVATAIGPDDAVTLGTWEGVLRFALLGRTPTTNAQTTTTTTTTKLWPPAPWLRFHGRDPLGAPVDRSFAQPVVRVGSGRGLGAGVDLQLDDRDVRPLQETWLLHRGTWLAVPGPGVPPRPYCDVVDARANGELITWGDHTLVVDADPLPALFHPTPTAIAVRTSAGDDAAVAIVDAVEGAAVAGAWRMTVSDRRFALSARGRELPVDVNAWTRLPPSDGAIVDVTLVRAPMSLFR